MSRHFPSVEDMGISKRQHAEDTVVLCAVTLALAAMGYFPERNSVAIRDVGCHRLYELSLLVRDGEPLDLDALEKRLLSLRRDLPVKPALYGADDYPANISGFFRVYLTVYI